MARATGIDVRILGDSSTVSTNHLYGDVATEAKREAANAIADQLAYREVSEKSADPAPPLSAPQPCALRGRSNKHGFGPRPHAAIAPALFRGRNELSDDDRRASAGRNSNP